MTMWLTAWDQELRQLFPTVTHRQLADHFNVDHKTVCRRCAALGLSRVGNRSLGWQEIDSEDVKDMLILGYSVRRISRETGYSRNYLHKVIQTLPWEYKRRVEKKR